MAGTLQHLATNYSIVLHLVFEFAMNKEREINKNLRSLNMTIIMIAHRKETIDMAERTINIGEYKL